jgi:hypothetical protein
VDGFNFGLGKVGLSGKIRILGRNLSDFFRGFQNFFVQIQWAFLSDGSCFKEMQVKEKKLV